MSFNPFYSTDNDPRRGPNYATYVAGYYAQDSEQLKPLMTERQYYSQGIQRDGYDSYWASQLALGINGGLAGVVNTLAPGPVQSTGVAPLYNGNLFGINGVAGVTSQVIASVGRLVQANKPIAGTGINVTPTPDGTGTTISADPPPVPTPGGGIGIITVDGVPQITNNGVISVSGSKGVSASGTDPCNITAVAPSFTFSAEVATFVPSGTFWKARQNTTGVFIEGYLTVSATQPNTKYIRFVVPITVNQAMGRFWNYSGGIETILSTGTSGVTISNVGGSATVTFSGVAVQSTTFFYVDCMFYT